MFMARDEQKSCALGRKSKRLPAVEIAFGSAGTIPNFAGVLADEKSIPRVSSIQRLTQCQRDEGSVCDDLRAICTRDAGRVATIGFGMVEKRRKDIRRDV